MKASTIQRNDNYDELSAQVKLSEEVAALRNENKSLSFIVAKYNTILTEYQMKYGNDLFLTIDKALTNANNETNVLNNDIISLKKKLVENIAIFKEYEKIILDKNTVLDGLNKDIAKSQSELHKMVDENEEIRKELETLKQENSEMYKVILDKNKILNVNQNPSTISEKKNEENENNEAEDEITALRNEKEKLMAVIENSKYQNEYNQNMFNDMKEKYENISRERDTLIDTIQKTKNDNDYLNNEVMKLQNQLKENSISLTKIEKEKNTFKSQLDKLQIETKIFKNEGLNFQDLCNEIEARKNKEIETLQTTLVSKQNEIDSLKQKQKINEEKISNYKFDLSQLKQENEAIKYDRDHLTKIIEDSSLAVQSADEKEKHFDKIVKNYQQKHEAIVLENEKLSQKLKMQQNQFSKFTNDYTSLIKEKCDQYENLLNLSKNKYETLLNNKNDELALLKTELTSTKIEKDKYASEYKLLKSEFDRINNAFKSDNANYIAKYEESQAKLTSMLTSYEEKVSELNIKLAKLESENRQNSTELTSFRSNEKLREAQFFKMTQNENLLMNQLNKTKEQLSFYMKSNEDNVKEKERLIAMYETKVKNLQEEHDIKIVTLENTINFQKDQLAMVEVKAFDMLKKQEGLTEKFKKEYFNTIEYYEGVIAYMSGRGADNGSNNELTVGGNKNIDDID